VSRNGQGHELPERVSLLPERSLPNVPIYPRPLPVRHQGTITGIQRLRNPDPRQQHAVAGVLGDPQYHFACSAQMSLFECSVPRSDRLWFAANGKRYQSDVIALPQSVPVDLRELLVHQLLYLSQFHMLHESAYKQGTDGCCVIMHRYSLPRLC